jgi:hypothetical protein
MNKKVLPELVTVVLNDWCGDDYKLCHWWVSGDSLHYTYYVICAYDEAIHFFRLFGNEKDGFNISKDNTYYFSANEE